MTAAASRSKAVATATATKENTEKKWQTVMPVLLSYMWIKKCPGNNSCDSVIYHTSFEVLFRILPRNSTLK
jgi:hypothetical protein